MPLAAAGLKAEILTQMDAFMEEVQDEDKRADYAEAIATAVVNYITANAVVTVTVSGGSSAGVHPGVIT